MADFPLVTHEVDNNTLYIKLQVRSVNMTNVMDLLSYNTGLGREGIVHIVLLAEMLEDADVSAAGGLMVLAGRMRKAGLTGELVLVAKNQVARKINSYFSDSIPVFQTRDEASDYLEKHQNKLQ